MLTGNSLFFRFHDIVFSPANLANPDGTPLTGDQRNYMSPGWSIQVGTNKLETTNRVRAKSVLNINPDYFGDEMPWPAENIIVTGNG